MIRYIRGMSRTQPSPNKEKDKRTCENCRDFRSYQNGVDGKCVSRYSFYSMKIVTRSSYCASHEPLSKPTIRNCGNCAHRLEAVHTMHAVKCNNPDTKWFTSVVGIDHHCAEWANKR